MIITAKPRIPFSWIVLAALPWVAVLFKDKLMGAAFTASMYNFVENPLALSTALAVAPLMSWAVPTIVNFLGDRVWTRYGRRKPFIVVSWLGTVTAIFLMPMAPSFETLVVLYVMFVVFNDLGSPAEALKMEIVPPSQRPVSTAVVHWINQVGVIVYFWVALGRFDEVNDFLGRTYSGQQGLFWTVGTAMVVMLAVLMLAVKETDPQSRLKGKVSIAQFFRSLFSSHIWPIYILAFSTGLTGAGIGAFDWILVTQQWGYTNQDVGNNIAIGGIINLALIPLIGLIATRTGRFRVYVTLVILAILVNIGRFWYYEFVLYDGRPTIAEMVFFGEMFSILGILSSIALVPLIYDHISRNELGIYAAGANIVGRGTGILLTALIGAFVTFYAVRFMPPAGESARLCLTEQLPRERVEQALASATWTSPTDGAPLAEPHLTARALYATGARLDSGYGWEVRLGGDGSPASSAERRDERDDLDSARNKAKARAKYARRLADEAVAEGRDATTLKATAAAEQAEVDRLTAAIDAIDAELQRRAEAFLVQARSVLGDMVMADGAQVLAASTSPAVVAALPLRVRPEGRAIEATLDALRRDPAVIDLRLLVTADGPVLELSLIGEADAARAMGLLRTSAAPGLDTALTGVDPAMRTAVAVALDLRTLEDPLDRHPAPIHSAIEWALGGIIGRHDPARRLRSIGRGLRRAGWLDHAAAAEIPGDQRAVRITAIVGEPPAGFTPGSTGAAGADAPKPAELASPGVQARLAPLGADATRGEALYAVAVRAAKEGRMTIARPTLEAGYAKQQYDYMAGYLAVFVIQMLGVGCILIFAYMVRTGRVTKRGVIEAEAAR
jgi:Na+/melibiose symporter-like transporter